MLKGETAAWQSTLQNSRVDEGVAAFVKGINYAPEDEKEAIDIITELLQTEERSAREITNLLRLDIKTKDLQKLIERIPGINTRTEKRTKFYTIGKQHTEPTLF